jgi:BirA family biotin operon repressor/biotin-[acetyl-CoA-carboxylase] ligase
MARLTALGALAVCQALRSDYGLQAQIKWPNDVLLERRKVAGVLAEAYWQGDQFSAAILGIGVNVAPAAVPANDQIIFPATCVETVLGRSLPRLELLRSILTHLLEWYTRLNEPEFLHTWEEQLAFRNEWVNIITGTGEADQQVHQGLVLGLDAQGCLQLRNPAGEIFTVRAGEVRLRPQASSVI